MAALSKLTFVTVVNSPSMMICPVRLEMVCAPSTALARPINHLSVHPAILRCLPFSHRHRHFLCIPYIQVSATLKTKHLLLHSCMLLLLNDFTVNTDGDDLPGDEFPAVLKCFLGCHFQPPAAGNFHPCNRYALYFVIANNFSQLFGIVN